MLDFSKSRWHNAVSGSGGHLQLDTMSACKRFHRNVLLLDRDLCDELQQLTKKQQQQQQNLIKKWAKNLSKHFSKVTYNWPACKHVKRCPVSLIVMEMQVTAMRVSTSPLEWPQPGNQKRTRVGKDRWDRPWVPWVGTELCACCGGRREGPKVINRAALGSGAPLLGGWCMYIPQSLTGRKLKRLCCPSEDEWVKKRGYMHRVKYWRRCVGVHGVFHWFLAAD